MKEKDFTEAYRFEGRVDEENSRISRVAIMNSVSRNNRVYSDKAMASILKLAEGTKSFLDHGNAFTGGSSVKDILGRFTRPTKDGNTIYANLEVLKNSPGRDMIFEIATSFPEMAGFSINARGKFADATDPQGREVVEDVVALRSVDFVGNPATVNGVWEQEDRETELTELRTEVADLKEKIRQKDLVIKYQDKQLKEKKEETKVIKPKTSKEEFFADLNKHL